MKKYCIAAALSMACLAPVAQADTVLGLYVGVDGWKADNDGSFSDNNNALQNFNFKDETFKMKPLSVITLRLSTQCH